MELSDNGNNGVSLNELTDAFVVRYPDEAMSFTKNYNQMKNQGVKNHAKVFDEDKGKTVWLWKPVRNFIIDTFS